MKRFSLFILLIITLLSCKKYNEDSFISTYSPEGRIKNRSTNIWILEKFIDENGFEKIIDKSNFNLKFNSDSLTVSSLNSDFSHRTSWNFENNKKNILVNGTNKLEILKLEVDKMRLKNEKGQTFWFKKVMSQDSLFGATESVIGIPLFGLLNGESSSLKLTKINNCEFNNINVTLNGNTVTSLVQGLFGNGFGVTNGTGQVTYSFSNYYSKTGYLTFYYKKNEFSSPQYFKVFINGIQVNYNQEDNFNTNNGNDWILVKVPINYTGSLNIYIQSSTTNGGALIKNIDEIKFWEYE